MKDVRLEEILGEKKPQYEPPKVITFGKDELLEELGPAQAITGKGTGDGIL